MDKQEHNALQLCVDALDQLLPYLAKVPADIGLINEALCEARPLLKGAGPECVHEFVPFRSDCTKCGHPYAEPAPAQDEREAFEGTLNVHSRRRNELGDYVRPSIQDRWIGWQARATRPAQTEQRPVAWVSSGPDGVEADWYPGKGLDTLPIGAKLYAAPVAQAEQQPALMSEEAASTLRGMVDYCLNQRVCMGMDEGFKSFDPEEEHDFVKELRAFAESAAPIAQTAPQPEHSGLVDMVRLALHNGQLVPDPEMDGSTEVFGIKIDDMEALEAVLSAHEK